MQDKQSTGDRACVVKPENEFVPDFRWLIRSIRGIHLAFRIPVFLEVATWRCFNQFLKNSIVPES